jgi:hypothetical protein
MWRLFVADFDLGSVPWAVEAAARDLYERQNDVGAYDDGMIVPEWGDPFYAETWEAHREKVRPVIAAFLSARGPCPNPECRGGYIESLDPRLMDPLVRTPCPDCLGSPGSGPTIAEKLT